MIQLIYISYATTEMSEDELLTLLRQSRDRNQRQKVTGMLLYKEGAFLQVLEGEAKDVDEIYQSIVADERNSGHYLIDRADISRRRFPEWSMGFKNLTRHVAEELAGFTSILDRPKSREELAQHRDLAKALLQRF